MKRKNIGRISMLIVFLNLIFIVVYLVGKNDTNFDTTDGNISTKMVVLKDETVDGDKITIFENIVKDHKYGKEELSKINSYTWYFTDNISKTDSFVIDEDIKQVTVFTVCEEYNDCIENALKSITEIKQSTKNDGEIKNNEAIIERSDFK